MDSDDDLKWPEGTEPYRLQKKRTLHTKLNAKAGSPHPDVYSIKKEAPCYRTPVKGGLMGLQSMICPPETDTALDAIDDSDSDHEMEDATVRAGLVDQQGPPKPVHAEPQPPRALHRVAELNGIEGGMKSSTPMSAQRQFMTSHLKPGLLNTISSSARRPDTKKGLGPSASRLQQLLKQRQETAHSSIAGFATEFLVQSSLQSQDLQIMRCSVVEEDSGAVGSFKSGSQSFEEVYIVVRPHNGVLVCDSARLKAQAPMCKFVSPDGLFIFLENFEVIN